MSPKTERGVSINPEEFSKGGILNDVDVEFLETRFMTGEDAEEQTDEMAKYPNFEETLFLAAKFKTDDDEVWQYWSSGKLIYFKPSSDGTKAVRTPGGTAERLSDSCNAYTLLASIVNAGYPRDKFEDDVSIFNGLHAHVIRVEQKKRAGLDSSSEDSPAKTVLTVESIIEPFPWEGGKRKGKGKTTGKAKAAESESGNEDFDEIAATTIVQILVDADGGPVKRTSVVGRMLKSLKKSHPDDFKAIIQATNEENFFEDHNDWEYDGKELEIGEGED